VAILFGLTVPVVVGSVGVAVDSAQAYLVRARLTSAIDASALAAASTGSDDEDVIQERVEAFMEANYPEGRIGRKLIIDSDLSGDQVTVTATARLDTSFMRVFGQKYVDVVATTIVQREVRGLEVVMVLDNTGSMTTNNNIETLRTATTSFINILFESVDDPEYVRVGLVPYASSVNVGPYGLGEDEEGGIYDTGFVEPPEDDVYRNYYNGMNPFTGSDYGIAEEDLEYDPSEKGQWHGCVLADDYPLDTADHEGPWEMYRYDHNGRNSYRDTDYYSSSSPNEGSFGDVYNAFRGPNYSCPVQPLVPL